MTVENFEFKAESQQVLNLMIHSLYSNQEIFLRELISNASDALDKLRFESLTKPELLGTDTLKIQIQTDETQKLLVISDNGIGMTKEELIKNLGTIAHSGTKAFLDKVKTEKTSKEAVSQLIGQFGVGFYSSFIVADKVEVISKKAGHDEVYCWRSTGNGQFEIEESSREKAGTTITLYLKQEPVNPAKNELDQDQENDQDDDVKFGQDFSRAYVLRQVIKRYSDFVQYPIELRTSKWVNDPVEGAADDIPENEKKRTQVFEWEQINSMKAIWAREQSEVSQDEYQTFYKHISKNSDQPFEILRHKASGGNFDYTYLVFLPSESSQSLFYRDQKHGLQLYVNRVMIMENCEDLVPEYFRFVKGVVESPDLSLNVSREILQQDRKLKIIRTRIVKRIVETLEKIKTDDRPRYEKFWEQFGTILKEGIIDFENADKLKPLFLFKSSTQDNLTSLSEYVSRMKEDQTEIYYLTAENVDVAQRSPHLEAFKEKGIEVLFMVNPVDEWMMNSFHEFDGKSLKSIGKGQIELGSEDEKKAQKEAIKEKETELADLMAAIQKNLDKHVKEVRLSTRLTNSPACLVVNEEDFSKGFEEMLRKMGQNAPTTKRVFELNPNHTLVEKLNGVFKANPEDAKVGQYVQLLFGQAQLAEGSQLAEPQLFSQALTAVMGA
jgi:molecular chaperone HtpG